MIFNQEVNIKATRENVLKVSHLGPISLEVQALAYSVENGCELQNIPVENGWLCQLDQIRDSRNVLGEMLVKGEGQGVPSDPNAPDT